MNKPPNSDALQKNLPPWLFFIFFLIGPPAALIEFAQSTTQNPLLIILIVLLYEIAFIGRKPLGKRFALRMQEIVSRYQQHYRECMVVEHQVIDFRGLNPSTADTLELEQVFINPPIRKQSADEASADPLFPPKPLQDIDSIWQYLSNPKMANRHLVILGAPGSGKTTLLKYLALKLAQNKKHPRKVKSHSFPILLFLYEHTRSIIDKDKSSFSLANAVEEHTKQNWGGLTIPASWIQRYLECGKCLVMLDGLDKIADASTREKVMDWVKQQFIRYRHNRLVLTSRPYGYQENLLKLQATTLNVQGFTLKQIEQFIQNYYIANELKSAETGDLDSQSLAQQRTQDLLTHLKQTPALLSLAVNPLLLTMIATIHRDRNPLPGKRVDLYAEIYGKICTVLLGKQHERHVITETLSPMQKQQPLQLLACWMMQNDKSEITHADACQVIGLALEEIDIQMPAEEFLQLVENTCGLFLKKKSGSYGFAHLTFQEYLTSVYIKDKEKEHVLIEQMTNRWWYETIRLYCAQADTTTQLDAFLKSNIEQVDPELRRVIADTHLTQRLQLHQMVSLGKDTYIDRSFITCAEYQVFLDEQQAQNHYYQPDHWTTISLPQGSGGSPILGIRRSDAQAFCNWLTGRDGEGWRYRLPRIGEWPLKEREQWQERHPETGYWTDDDESRFAWVGRAQPPVDFQQGLDEAFELARTTILDSTNILDLTIEHNPSIILDLDLVLNLELNDALALALQVAHIYNSDLHPTLTLDRAPGMERERFINLNMNLILDHIKYMVALAVRNNPDENDGSGKEKNGAEAHKASQQEFLDEKARSQESHHQIFDQDAFNKALNLYVVLLLLQKRIAGKFPAYEGILLVKGRQSPPI